MSDLIPEVRATLARAIATGSTPSCWTAGPGFLARWETEALEVKKIIYEQNPNFELNFHGSSFMIGGLPAQQRGDLPDNQALLLDAEGRILGIVESEPWA